MAYVRNALIGSQVDKKLYKGTFNISGQTVELWTKAVDIDKAFMYFITRLSKKYEFARHYFLSMFDGSKDNYHVEEVVNGKTKTGS